MINHYHPILVSVEKLIIYLKKKIDDFCTNVPALIKNFFGLIKPKVCHRVELVVIFFRVLKSSNHRTLISMVVKL